MRNQGLGSWPARRARMTPARTSVVHGATEYDYRRFAERVGRLAAGLREQGVRAGDRIAYLGTNHPAFLETMFAAGLLGAIFVPVNFRLTAPEIEYVLADSGAGTVIFSPSMAATLAEVDPSAAPCRIALAEPASGAHDYAALLARAAPLDSDEPVELAAPCLIMYTSGSTGQPKGAVLTHGNLTWNCMNVLVESDMAGDDVALVVAPLFHIATLGMVTLPTLLKGGSVVLHEGFDPGAVLDAIERHRITIMFGVPTMFQAIADHPRFGSAELSSVRALLCGGSPVPADLIKRYLARRLAFVQGYGMTETSPGALLLDRQDVTRKAGSAGVPSFFTDVRVVRPDMSTVDPGENGEVVISGPNVMAGYWHKPAETEAAVQDGWFHSGDVATVDEDGYVYIVDRLKDMIISGGENIYPAEVESALYAHPAVARCAVIGVPDRKWGEVGKAVVVPRDGAEPPAEAELLAFLRERLAGYKVPKSVVFVAELPVTGSGKILKKVLRERYARPTS